MKKLSPLARKALLTLKMGGKFVKKLEMNKWAGREMFVCKLLTPSGNVMKGYGFKTFWEVEPMLVIAEDGTSVSTYYKLPAEKEVT